MQRTFTCGPPPGGKSAAREPMSGTSLALVPFVSSAMSRGDKPVFYPITNWRKTSPVTRLESISGPSRLYRHWGINE